MKTEEKPKPTIYLKRNDSHPMAPYEITTNLEGEKILEGIGLGNVTLLPNSCDDNLTVVLVKEKFRLERILGTVVNGKCSGKNLDGKTALSEKVYSLARQYAEKYAQKMPGPSNFINEVKEPVPIDLRTL